MKNAWQAAGRLSYAGIPYNDLQQGTQEAPNPNELAIAVHLATLQMRLTAPTATQLSVLLPSGRLSTTTIQDNRTDTNVGDAEIRLRQTLPWLSRPRIDVGVGMVLPTGPYVERSGAANLPPEASYLTLGRGVSWASAELQASVPVTGSASTYVQLSARMPLSYTRDEFSWGSEARAVLGAQFRLPSGFTALAIAEWQWRGGASEPDPFVGGRIESPNAGGTWWTVTPAVSYAATGDISVLGGVRLPVHTDVSGNQLVPGIGAFLALSASWSTKKKPQALVARKPTGKPFVKPEPSPGVITIVDYWATWCAPCKKIDAALKAAESDWPDVRIIRVDASDWPDSGVELPDGAEGLPVVEVFGVDGERAHLLRGSNALQVVDIVNTMRNEQSSAAVSGESAP